MKLKHVIEMLEKFPADRPVALGFGNPHSWRGSYDELAFEPVENTTVGQMLEDAKSAVGATYEGWKGGEFLMTLDTPVNIDYVGRWSDGENDHILHTWMVEQ
jgi:hypothetical protein